MSDYVTPLGAITAPPLPHFLPTHNCHCAPLVLPEFDLLQLSATYDADGSTYKNWTGWLPGWKSRFELRQIGRSTRKLASYDERSVFDGANASGNGARDVRRRSFFSELLARGEYRRVGSWMSRNTDSFRHAIIVLQDNGMMKFLQR